MVAKLSLSPMLQKLDRLESSAPKGVSGIHLEILAAARALFEKSQKSTSYSKKLQNRLYHRLIAAEYRIQGGQLNSPDAQLLISLMEKAREWKKRQLPFKNKNLEEQDLRQLEKLACYPQMLKLLLEDRHGLNAFFKWAILNHLSVQIFTEFPVITHKIDASLLKPRSGAYGGNELQYVVKEDKKDVLLMMEGKPVSILDGTKQVQLSHHLVMTVDAIFNAFRKKNYVEGFLTFFKGEGICNWDPHKMGPINGISKKVDELNLNVPHWYRQLRMLDHFTTEEANQRFEKIDKPCDGTNFVMTLVATRQTEKINVAGSHSFIRLAIPRGDGSYDYTYGWGKYAKDYPQGNCETASYLFGPTQGTLEYPENNEIYTNRQKIEEHFYMTPKQGSKCLQSIRRNLLEVRKNNFPFQILTHHCTEWVAKKISKYVGKEQGKRFDVAFFKIKAHGFLGTLVRILAKTPVWFRQIFLFFFACCLGGTRKLHITNKDGTKRVISVLKRPPWKEGRIFRHPAIAFQRINH